MLQAIMDISARAISLPDRLQRAIWVTSVRMRREDRSSISSHPLMWNEFLPISIPITAITLLCFSDMACSFRLAPPASLLAGRAKEHGRTIPLPDLMTKPSSTCLTRLLSQDRSTATCESWSVFPLFPREVGISLPLSTPPSRRIATSCNAEMGRACRSALLHRNRCAHTLVESRRLSSSIASSETAVR